MKRLQKIEVPVPEFDLERPRKDLRFFFGLSSSENEDWEPDRRPSDLRSIE